MKTSNSNKAKKFTNSTLSGISLIVLIITIIVIIILSTTIIVSVLSNNPVEEANKARYESDVDSMQAVFTNTVAKIMAQNRGTVSVTAGSINTVTGGVKETTGEVNYTVTNAINADNASGKIYFDKGTNTGTEYYTGKKLPIYAAGATTWYVDEEGIITLEVGDNAYGEEEREILTADIIMDNPSNYYGKTVKYNSEKGSNYDWQIFHADEGGIYIIAKDYVSREDIPYAVKDGSVTANKPVGGSYYDKSAYFDEALLADYENGSDDIDETMKSLNSEYFALGYTSTYNNMKAVAYMLDTDAWSAYANDKANWAIGGPSLELLCKSYNTYKGSEELIIEEIEQTGYGIWNTIEVGEANDMYSIFYYDKNIGINYDATGYWLASPDSYDTEGVNVVYEYMDTCISGTTIDNDAYGFRPIVYLKSSTVLKEQKDGSYLVK